MPPLDLDALARQYRRQMVAWAEAIVGNREDAEDVVQTVLLRLVARAQQTPLIDPARYLHLSVRRQAWRVVRRRQREEPLDDE